MCFRSWAKGYLQKFAKSQSYESEQSYIAILSSPVAQGGRRQREGAARAFLMSNFKISNKNGVSRTPRVISTQFLDLRARARAI